jgi:hypothetical protein
MPYLIYKHTNILNGKVYIGQTGRSVKQRWGKDGQYYKQCSKFWNAIQKYGWHNFSHEILIANITTRAEANQLEQYYIEEVYDSVRNGYNISKGGFDKSYCEKGIYQLNAALTVLNKYTSAAEAERLTGIDRGSISKCCLGKAITAGNFYWCFESDYDQYTVREKSTVLSREVPVEQLDIKTNKVIAQYKSFSEAARVLNIASGAHIGHCCAGHRKTAYGYKWRYANEER